MKIIEFLKRKRLQCEDCAHYDNGRCYAQFIGPDRKAYTIGFSDGYLSFSNAEEFRRGVFTKCGVFAKDFTAKEEFYALLKEVKP